MKRIGLAVTLTISTLMLTACNPRPEARAIPERPTISIQVLDGGALQIEGKVYADEPALRAKIAELQSRDPPPKLMIRAEKNMRFEDVGRAIVLLQRVGLVKVGFITEPDGPVREREAQ